MPRVQFINPKRNSERRAFDQILQSFRQQNRTLDAVIAERITAQLSDATFENYPSIGDLYYLVFEHRTKDGGDRREHMRTVTEEFNAVVQAVFEQYALVSEWNDTTGTPAIRVKENAGTEFPLEGLSLGEQEVLALVASMHASLDKIDVYVIDEPEVHLNWHLEERLFAYIDDLCTRHHKQAIVATHKDALPPHPRPRSPSIEVADPSGRGGL